MRTFLLFALFLASIFAAEGQEATTSDVSFPNSPVGDVLTFYERLAGKHVIRDNNLNNLTVTIVANKPMGPSEAMRFVESGLLLNGVALVPAGTDALKAVVTATRKPGGEGVSLIYGVDALPDGDSVVCYFMPLQYLKAAEAKKLFETQVPPHDYGAISIAPGMNALLITESASIIRHFLELQALLDKEPTSVVNHFVELTRSDAGRVSELVLEALKVDDSDTAGANQAVKPEDKLGGSIEGVRLIPDKRSNRILVICRPASFNLVRNLINQFDAPTEVPRPKSFVLKFVSALDILQVLVDALSQAEDAAGQQSGALPAAPVIQAVNRQSPASNSYGAEQTPGENGSTVSRADQLVEEQDSAPVSVNVGKTWIAADPRANKILISGPPESVEKIQRVIDELDQKPKQVYLATVIGQLTLGDGFQFGIDYLQRFSSNGNGTGIASALIGSAGQIGANGSRAGVGAGFVDPTALVRPENIVTALNGLSVYGVVGDAVEYYVKALETTNRFKVLSRPVVYTANNKKAKIATGQRIPVPVNTLTTAGTTVATASVQSSIAFQDVLLKLEVIPLINANGDVTLKIAQTNDSVIGNQEVSGNSIPIIGTQELNTTITVPNGKTIVLGGLVSEDNTRDTRGIPWLSRIPGVGYLFRTTERKSRRQELLIFIQPVVVDDIQSAKIQTEAEKKRSNIEPTFDPIPKELPHKIETRIESPLPAG